MSMNIEWGKLGLLTGTLAGCFGCLISKTADPEVVVPVITLIVGYITGNGRLASKGDLSVPLIAPDNETMMEKLAARIEDRLRRPGQ